MVNTHFAIDSCQRGPLFCLPGRVNGCNVYLGMSGTAMTNASRAASSRYVGCTRHRCAQERHENAFPSTLAARTPSERLSNGFGTLAAETGSSMPELSCCSFRPLDPDGGVQVSGLLDFPSSSRLVRNAAHAPGGALRA